MWSYLVLGVLVLLVLMWFRRRRGRISGAGAANAISVLTGMRSSELPVFHESPKGRRWSKKQW